MLFILLAAVQCDCGIPVNPCSNLQYQACSVHLHCVVPHHMLLELLQSALHNLQYAVQCSAQGASWKCMFRMPRAWE